jgi:hypothetical protein
MKSFTYKKIVGIVFSAIVLVLILSILTPALGVKNKPVPIANTPNTGYGYGYGCSPHSQGYWQNHQDDWPVNSITIGGITYTKEDAITLMKMPGSGDKTYDMFQHLVAAKLNIFMGCDPSCIDEVILDADAWMAIHPVGSGVNANSPAWDDGEPLKDMLADYNNGYLCW